MRVDDKNTTTTYIETDGSPPAIVMGIETDATYRRDPETKGEGKADNLDGTFSANEAETDNMNINKASATTSKKSLFRKDNSQSAIIARPMISTAVYMDALLDAMSPECKALIIEPTEAPVAKVCKPLNYAFRKGMQKTRDRQFRILEPAYYGHSPSITFKQTLTL